MFNDFFNLFLDQFSNFWQFLSNVVVISGVPYVLIFAAFLITCALIHNFVSRG